MDEDERCGEWRCSARCDATWTEHVAPVDDEDCERRWCPQNNGLMPSTHRSEHEGEGLEL